MNTEHKNVPPVFENPYLQSSVADELTRVKIFLGIQAFFLVVSVFTGGFNLKLWSMLDTALMIQSIGITALVVVLEDARHRRLAFKAAIVIYLWPFWTWASTSAFPASSDGSRSELVRSCPNR